jgi:cell division protein FtsQ
MLKKILRKIIPVLLVIGVLVLIVLSFIHMRNRECSDIKVTVQYAGLSNPVSQEDIIAMIERGGIATVGIPLKEINTDSIRLLLSTHPYIREVDKIRFIGKTLSINLIAKDFLLHVYPSVGEQFFISNEGEILPYSDKVQERLIIVNGFINKKYKVGSNITWLKKSPILSAYNIAHAIQQNEFAKVQFRQIYINENQEIELIPSVGRLTVLFGDDTDAAEKLVHLREVYRNGLIYTNINQYTQLDVRFKNRVIAKKR